MLAWQRWQASDFMKYCEGMLTSCLVCAELGKNFPPEPSPSRSIESGGNNGLMMRLARASRQPISRVHHNPAEVANTTRTSPANRNAWLAKVCPSHPLEWSQSARSNRVPATHKTMCAYSEKNKTTRQPALGRLNAHQKPLPNDHAPEKKRPDV